jgi:hypothetical protein
MRNVRNSGRATNNKKINSIKVDGSKIYTQQTANNQQQGNKKGLSVSLPITRIETANYSEKYNLGNSSIIER